MGGCLGGGSLKRERSSVHLRANPTQTVSAMQPAVEEGEGRRKKERKKKLFQAWRAGIGGSHAGRPGRIGDAAACKV